jgi:hypothetical protein
MDAAREFLRLHARKGDPVALPRFVRLACREKGCTWLYKDATHITDTSALAQQLKEVYSNMHSVEVVREGCVVCNTPRSRIIVNIMGLSGYAVKLTEFTL